MRVFNQLLEFARDQFVFGFGKHFPLVLLAYVIALVLAGCGRSWGGPQLVYSSAFWNRVRNGAYLGQVFVLMFLVSYMLEWDTRNNHGVPQFWTWHGPPSSFRLGVDVGPLHSRPLYWYGFGMLISSTAIGGFVLALYVGLSKQPIPSVRLGQVASIIFGMAISVITWLAAIEFTRWYHPASFYQVGPVQIDLLAASPHEAGLHVLLLLHFLVTVVIGIICSADRRLDSTMPVLAVGFWMVIVVHAYGFVLFWHGTYWPFVLLVLGLAFLRKIVTRRRYRHRLRGFANAYDKPQNHEEPAPIALRPELQPLPWFAGETPGQAPLILFAVSGAGTPGAIWTSLLLDRLNREFPGLTHQIHQIAGSGGAMLAAAYHAATLQAPRRPGLPVTHMAQGRSITHADITCDLAADLLSPMLRTAAFDDVVHSVLPGRRRDRGDAWEDAIHANTRTVLEASLGSLIAGEQAGWRPSLIFAPRTTLGERVLISNRDLGPLTIQGPSSIGWELFRVFGNQGTLSISTAVRMVAGLPWLAPTAELPTIAPIHVVNDPHDDAGMIIAGAWLEEALRHPTMLPTIAKQIVLVRISDQPLNANLSPMLAGLTRGMYETLGPDGFHMLDLVNPVACPANWFATPEDIAQMIAHAQANNGPLQTQINRLREWMH